MKEPLVLSNGKVKWRLTFFDLHRIQKQHAPETELNDLKDLGRFVREVIGVKYEVVLNDTQGLKYEFEFEFPSELEFIKFKLTWL